MMYYVIDKPTLIESVVEEISGVADKAYSEDGTPLYDSVMVTLRDKPTIERMIDDAVSQFVSREFDITKYSPETATDDGQIQLTGRMRLQFNVPDFDRSMAELDNNDVITGGSLKTELDRYIVLFVCAAIFKQRRASVVEEYITRSAQAMDTAIAFLKYRKAPEL